MRGATYVLGIAIATVTLTSSSFAFDNVRGRSYLLTPRHGPWMIMVTSFRDIRDTDLRTPGMTAEQAAAELVYELRDKGIPAYTYSQDAMHGEVQTRDRFGEQRQSAYVARQGMICVLAGNYDSIDDPIGQKTLAFVKELHPKFLNDSRNGAVTRTKSQERGALAGAFLTINPLRDPQDVAEKNVDPQTKRLNAHSNHSLIKNPKKYTIQVATLQGRSTVIPSNGGEDLQIEQRFTSRLSHQSHFGLDLAGEDAEHLAAFLRSRWNGTRDTIYEAYTFHSKFESIVTVGSFDTSDDPQIAQIIKHYEAKLVPDHLQISSERRRQPDPLSEEELETLPKTSRVHTETLMMDAHYRRPWSVKTWAFDATPKVILVPRIN